MDEATKKQLIGQTPEVMKVAAGTIRELATQVVDLEEENAAQGQLIHQMKIARRMEERGHRSDLDFDAKVAYVATFDTDKLAAFEQALEMTAGGEVALGRVETTGNDEGNSPVSLGELDEFITSGQALS